MREPPRSRSKRTKCGSHPPPPVLPVCTKVATPLPYCLCVPRLPPRSRSTQEVRGGLEATLRSHRPHGLGYETLMSTGPGLGHRYARGSCEVASRRPSIPNSQRHPELSASSRTADLLTLRTFCARQRRRALEHILARVCTCPLLNLAFWPARRGEVYPGGGTLGPTKSAWVLSIMARKC